MQYAREYDLYLKHGHLLGPGRASRRRLPAAPPLHLTPAKAKKSEVVKAEQNKGSVEIIEVAPSGSNRSRKIANSLNRTDPVPITITPAKGSSRKGKSTAQTSEPLQDVEEIQPQVAASGKGGKRKAEPASSTSQRKGKRIRGQVEERSPSPLLVSTAAFRLTCPEQNVEPDLRFGESMEQYLRSYTMLEENDVDENALRHQINSTAKTRERIRLFRKHGRMLGQLEENSDSEEEGEGEKEAARTDRTSKKMTISAMKAFPEPKRLPDHNEHLLGHVTQVRNAMLVDWKVRTANSRKIARAIQIYWERELNKDDITEKMEERRRKQVMRELVKAIKAKWQLAVNVVRAKRLAAEKAEQERVGKEHLQSILERSRNLLGNPQTPDESMSEGDERVEGSDEDIDQEEEEDEDEEEKEEEAENQLDAGELGTEAKSEAERIGDGGEDDEREEEEEEQEQLEAHRFGPSERGDPANTGRPRSEGGESNASRDLEAAGLSGDSQTTPLHQASPPDGNNVGESLQESGEIPLRPRRSRVTYKAASHVGGPSEDPDISDVEFAAEDVSDEDHIMDVEMEEEEAVMDSDDEEDAGLLADAGLPLEELMAKYGYGANPAAVTSNHQPGALSADENMDEVESLDDAGSMSEDDVTSNGSSDVSPQEEEANPSMRTPFLIRANLRPYQSAGLEWLAQLYREQRNAILADEMGLGKTLQTIALLAHLACDHGRWGPHLIVVPTSVILNWEMEFKKFLPGFKVLTYYGSQQERKELRKGWLAPHAFEVLITSYQIVLADQFQFKRRKWEYLILDEAHNIKNFRSQRWQTLLGFRSERRLLLTGTPLQNNLMELWSLLYFLMPQGLVDDEDNGGFANHKEFNEWFSSEYFDLIN
jgi:helicase SWR1